jgi:hypothetical protein
LPDEKLMKSVLDLQKTIADRHYKAIDEMARAAQPLAETLNSLQENSALGQLSKTLRAIEESSGSARMRETVRLLEENSSVKSMLENVNLHQELARTALGPMWELRQAGIFDLDAPWRREMGVARQAMEGFETRFRLPEMTETTRLLAEFKTSALSETLARYAGEAPALQRAMESMCTPWLDAHEVMRSMTGFAEMQGIGQALRSLPAFDVSLSAALRFGLGDWRDQITWRPEIFTDLTARADFYVGLGFNPALTDFPLPAFEQSLDIAGLRRELPPIVEGYGPPVTSEGDEVEEDGLARTNAAHDRLQRMERLLRKFIDEEMTRAFGVDWPKNRLPNGLYDAWQDKKRKAEEAGAEERPLIEYADFTHYAPLICRTGNWREVFMPFFVRPESVRESFQRLHPIRLDVAHARLITQDDVLLLCVEVKRLVKVIRVRRS